MLMIAAVFSLAACIFTIDGDVNVKKGNIAVLLQETDEDYKVSVSVLEASPEKVGGCFLCCI